MKSRFRLAQRLPWASPAPESPLSVPVSQRQAAVVKIEGEDAAMTGLTRSLHRRLLGLNLGQRTALTGAEVVPDELKVA